MKIVFIDDDKGFEELIGRFLAFKGYKDVSFVYTSQEGREYIEKNKPDLAFLDINMESNTSGLDTLAWGRKNCPDTRYVMCSAYREDFRDLAMKSGADGFLCKPTRPDDLLRTIASFEKQGSGS